jgi:predicted ribosomally synthesized peptide with nif11-like leader
VTVDKNFARNFVGVESPDALMQIVRYAGYDFTREDLKHAIVTLSDMSEAELGRISGGFGQIEDQSVPQSILQEMFGFVL